MTPIRKLSLTFVILGIAIVVISPNIAGALTGKNTVFSDDITNGEVKTGDVRSEAVTTPKLSPGAVTTSRLASGAVTASKVAADSLTGAKIDESTLQITPEGYIAVGPGADAGSPADKCATQSGSFCGSYEPPLGSCEPYECRPWQNYGSGWAPAGFYKDREGVVHIRGMVRTLINTVPYHSSAPDVGTIFKLPTGYRPAFFEEFPVTHAEGKPALVTIYPDGRVQAWAYSGGWDEELGVEWMSLSGIEFRAGA